MDQNLSLDEPQSFNNLPESDIFYNEKLQRLSGPTNFKSGLQTEVESFIIENFSSYYQPNIIKPKQAKIDYMDNLFNEFKAIESNKHQHNLKWAMKRAQEEFTYDQLKKAHKQTDCFGVFDEVVEALRSDSKSKINNLSKRFSILSNVVSLLDILISVVLIVIVSMLSHLGDKVFDTVLISSLFLATVALTKVSLDRFAIMPLIDSYGWKLFHKSINYARQESIKINGMYLVLLESIARNESIETRYKLINNQKNIIFSDNNHDIDINSNLSGTIPEIN